MENRSKAAVIGTGSIGYRHMHVLKDLGVPMIAVPIRDERASFLRSEGWTCAISLQAAKQAGANFAVVATDTRRHAQDTSEALDLGLHVLLEKPMALSASEAEPLRSLAAKQGLRLFIGCNLRFDPGLQAARKKLEEIGTVHSVRIECGSFLPEWRPNRDYRSAYSAKASEGGVLRDLIHEVDYALWLFGIPTRIIGQLGNSGQLGIESEEMADGYWTNRSGTRVSMSLDYLSRRPRRFFCAHGDKGDLEYNFITRTLRLNSVKIPAKQLVFKRTLNDSTTEQMKEFLRTMEGHPPLLLTSAQDGINALVVCDAWRRSAANDCAEQINL